MPAAPDALERAAMRRLDRSAGSYLAGGAGLERTMAVNRAAFDRYRIVPRMLRDTADRDLGITLFGRRLPAPLLLAPIGVLELAHRGADPAAARAAADAGLPFVTSSQASRPLEEIADTMRDGPRWFQLYWPAADELAHSFVRRAEAAGYEALVVTLDTTQLGWRPRDLDERHLPFLHGRGLANYLSDPVFRNLPASDDRALRHYRPGLLDSLSQLLSWPLRHWPALASGAAQTAVRRFLSVYSRPDLTFADLPRLCETTRLPVLAKGILHPDDARRALDGGCAGIIVSNHGGRQVDGAVAALDALPGVVAAVGTRAPVLFDSGVRTGADMMKCLCLGATAVLIGRPYAYGLALAGEAGVASVIANFLAECDLTMALAGYRSVTELDRSALVEADP